MDSIDFDSARAKKVKALLSSYNPFCRVGFFFRVTEICVALLMLCWMFTCLPFAVRISGEFLRRLACVVSTPLFMFVLGNSIVVALLTTKFTVFSVRRTTDDGDGEDSFLFDPFIRSGENRADSADGDLTGEIVVYDDKQIIADSNSNSNLTAAREDHAVIETEEDSVPVTESAEDHPPAPNKVYRRSKSEVVTKLSTEIVSKPSLRRSETAKCRKIIETCEEEDPLPEDNMSNEEFQKTIEAFIAKQLVFRRRESLAVVIHNTDAVESI